MGGTRVALLVGCSGYDDPEFRRLQAPDRDLDALKHVLEDPTIGHFDVDTLLNEASGAVNEKIEKFFANRKPDDLLLLYFSCHGVLDAKGRLYFVAANSQKELLAATGISAHWVKQQMDQSRAQRIVLLLDCCYSGAFITKGRKPVSADAQEILEQQLAGRGRIVITASDKMELSYESEFTDAVVRGLGTGAADRDGDGQVEVHELYLYVYDQVRENTSGQTPTMSADGIRGQVYLAKNPHAPLLLPADLTQALESKIVWRRRWAVNGLLLLLTGDHAGGLKITARQVLIRLRDHDTKESVRAAADEALNEISRRPEFTDRRPKNYRRSVKVIVAVTSVAVFSLASLLVIERVNTGEVVACSPSTRPADGVLSLGTLLPITGSAIFRSPALETSVQLAMEDIIKAGGIPEVVIKLDEDNKRDEGDPLMNDVVSLSVDQLVSNGVDVVIGPVSSVASAKVIDNVTCAGLIMLSPSNVATLFTTYPDHGLYFRTSPTALMEGPVLGRLVVADGNSTVVLMSRDDVYGNSLREETEKVIGESGGQVLDSFPFDPNARNYSEEIRRIENKNPDAIVLIGFTESARILTSMAEKGLGPQSKRLYGSSANMSNTLASQVLPRNSGVLAGMKGTLIDLGDETFVKRLREANPTIRDLAYSAQAYDAVMITALAAAVARTDEPAAVAKEINGVTRDGEKCTNFAACMTFVKDSKNIDYDGPSGPLEFTDPGEPSSAIYVISEFQADGTVKSLNSERVSR